MASPSAPIRINVNRKVHHVEATPDTPLLYVLRDNLGLNAAKYGCGFGRCGACTVHLDGQAAFSCMTSIGEVGDRQVTTLEGLTPGDELHPLQQAFLDEQAAQCGYCVPGIVMTAAAMMEHNPRLTDAEIRNGLEGSLCRCGSHVRILRAIHNVIESGR